MTQDSGKLPLKWFVSTSISRTEDAGTCKGKEKGSMYKPILVMTRTEDAGTCKGKEKGSMYINLY